MKLTVKEFLHICKDGEFKKSVYAYFKKKGAGQNAIDSILRKLKKQNKIQEINTPKGKMLVALH